MSSRFQLCLCSSPNFVLFNWNINNWQTCTRLSYLFRLNLLILFFEKCLYQVRNITIVYNSFCLLILSNVWFYQILWTSPFPVYIGVPSILEIMQYQNIKIVKYSKMILIKKKMERPAEARLWVLEYFAAPKTHSWLIDCTIFCSYVGWLSLWHTPIFHSQFLYEYFNFAIILLQQLNVTRLYSENSIKQRPQIKSFFANTIMI